MTSTSSSRLSSAPDEPLFLSYLDALKPIPVLFHDGYQAPPELLPARVAVLNLEVLPPPEKKPQTTAANLAEVLSVTFKSLKPAYSVTLPIQPADSIQALKSHLTSQPSTPLSNSTLRLLLKGKALADSKLVKDYDIKDGSVITVMMSASAAKPTAPDADTPTADVTSSTAPPAASPSVDPTTTNEGVPPSGTSATSPNLTPSTPGVPGHRRRVSDIPAVTLSPAGTPAATTPLLQPVTLTSDPLSHVPLTPGSPSKSTAIPVIDLASIPIPMATTSQYADDPYHQVLASPRFWKDLRAFLEDRFGKEKIGRVGGGEAAFEEFLRSVKSNLSPHEIAKIRDEVGITGMGGN